LSKGYDRKFIRGVIYQVKHALPANHVISTFYYPTICLVHILGEREVFHIIKLVGDPEMQVLYCYVELFNCNHTLIIVNNHYDGPAINDQFCYNVLTSTYIEKEITLPFKHRAHVIDLCKVDHDTNPKAEAAYRHTRQILEEAIRAKGHII
jgi:hypothetical protein